jgi:hypothetical protein
MEPLTSAAEDVYVRDFGAAVNDRADQAEAIRSAIRHAIANRCTKVIFDAGTYTLTSSVSNTAHADHGWSENHLFISGYDGLTLEGQVDEDGNPATVLEGRNDGKNQAYLPSILWISGCGSFTLKNMKFTRSMPYSSAGIVTEKGERHIIVDVFESNPLVDGMACYCANRFDLSAGALLGESVTYGEGAGASWRRIGGGSDRRMRLDSSAVAAQVSVGEGLSWHFGSLTDFQLQFEHCSHLTIENIHTVSANGFAMQTECCSGVTATRVVFKPEGNLLFTAPRDAWKIYKCSGDFAIREMVVEGVRMDGQNMHSTFLTLVRIVDERTVLLQAKWNYAPLKDRTDVEFWNGTDTARRTIRSWRHEGYMEGANVYSVTFEEKLPEPLSQETLAVPMCWSLSSYVMDGGMFKNVAGCGHVVRYDNVKIRNVRYVNLMNQGIFIGCEHTGFHEAGHPRNVEIGQCIFENCGGTPRMGASGAIGINAEGLEGLYMEGITIEDCLFRNLKLAVDISDAKLVTMRGNRFEAVQERCRVDAHTTSQLNLEDEMIE